jgi:hypothetical protein
MKPSNLINFKLLPPAHAPYYHFLSLILKRFSVPNPHQTQPSNPVAYGRQANYDVAHAPWNIFAAMQSLIKKGENSRKK